MTRAGDSARQMRSRHYGAPAPADWHVVAPRSTYGQARAHYSCSGTLLQRWKESTGISWKMAGPIDVPDGIYAEYLANELPADELAAKWGVTPTRLQSIVRAARERTGDTQFRRFVRRRPSAKPGPLPSLFAEIGVSRETYMLALRAFG